MHGGPGDDIVHGGGGIDYLYGDDGDDSIYPDSGPDAVDAGPGNDKVFINYHQKMGPTDCGPGRDIAYIVPHGTFGWQSPYVAGRIVNCEVWIEAEPTPDPLMGVRLNAYSSHGETVRGTEKNDQLTGASGPDALYGLGGDDVLWGNRLPTGASNGVDVLDGGAGNDRIFGSRGRNRIDAGDGDDYVAGGQGGNTILGGSGNDAIRFNAMHRAYSKVDAGPGDDAVFAYGRGPIKVRCGDGLDTVKISFNRRIKVNRDCETVQKRYKGRVRRWGT